MAYIGNQPVPQATQTRDRFVATASQTSFATSGYTPGFLDVYLNGVKLDSTDYTATNGSDVVLASGAASGDILEVVAYSAFEIARLYDSSTNSTGYFALPAGTTAQRPGSPAAGYTRMNTTTGSVEFYDGTNWIATNLIPSINSITGTIYAGIASTLTLSLTNATDTIDVKYYEGGTLLATDTGVTVTSGSATSTVPSAVYGQTAGDTISIQIFNQDGTPSSNSINKTVQGLPTGGTITSSGGYRVHTFASSSSFVVPSGFSATAEYLIVAGGGGGGAQVGGGGGAGGLRSGSSSITANTYTVTVGAAGSGSTSTNSPGSTGGNSSALSITSNGGGGGGSHGCNNGATSGGSGGGGGGGTSGSTAGASGTSGQGYAGGSAHYQGTWLGGGGGGAGGVGGDYVLDTRGGNGGVGVASSISGSSVYYAGGGGGCGQGSTYQGGSGGNGGGGHGWGDSGSTISYQNNGTANTGGGGGGHRDYPSVDGPAGNGGSGIVIIRYQL